MNVRTSHPYVRIYMKITMYRTSHKHKEECKNKIKTKKKRYKYMNSIQVMQLINENHDLNV